MQRTIAVCFALCAATSFAAQPLPDKEKIDSAARIVGDTYRKELATEEGLVKILEDADGTTDDAPGQAAMYLIVARRAAEDGRLRVAFDAIDRLARRFEYDALAAKTNMLQSAIKGAKSMDDKASVVNRSLELLDEALADERFDVADDAAKVAGSLVPKLKDPELRKELAAKRKELDRLKKASDAEWKAVSDAEATLKRSPGDARAHETLGRRLASIGDWQRAVPHLLKAADGDLRDAAKLDASAAADPKVQMASADAWWEQADSFDGKERRAYMARSVYWYTLALPMLSGILKTRAEKRIEEAGKVDLAGQSSGDDNKVTLLLAPGVPLVLVKIPASKDGKVKGFWLGKTEVTEAQWGAVVGGGGGDMPKTNLTRHNCLDFTTGLDERFPRLRFRLPTTDEFLYAYGSPSRINAIAWHKTTSGNALHPVGKLAANEFGLLDIAGNAFEFTTDQSRVYGGSLGVEITGPCPSQEFAHDAKHPDMGFRVAADLR